MKDGICYIVGAAEFSRGFLPSEKDFVIAADGGYDRLASQGIAPNLLIGDLDSIESVGAPCDIELLKFKVEKDETDTHLAFLEGMRRGYRSFLIYGGSGGREDHTFANYSLLLYAARHGASARLVSDRGECFVIENGEAVIPHGKYRGVSVFAFGGTAEGVSVKGLKYQALDVQLTPDFPLGVSNSFVGHDAFISVRRGALLIMLRYED